MNTAHRLDWIFRRLFGVLDIKRIFASKPYRDNDAEHWGTIYVHNDMCIKKYVSKEEDDIGKSWFSAQLFCGTERKDFGAEYWVVVSRYFYAPVFPAKIIEDQTIFKLGKDCREFNSIIDVVQHNMKKLSAVLKDKTTHLIIKKADIEFKSSKVSFTDSPVWAAYD